MGQNVFERHSSGVLLYRMQGDYYEGDFTTAGAKNKDVHAVFGVETSIGDSTESNTYISRDFLLAHMHAYCARRADTAAPFVTIVRQDQLQDELEIVARTLQAYGIEHKTFVGRERTGEAVAYFARRTKPADVRAVAANADRLAAQAVSAASARHGVFMWRTGGMLTPRATLAAIAEMTDGFFEAPRDAVLLDLRRSTLNLSAAQFADCLDTIERGFGVIAAPMAALMKPDDAPLMDVAAERAIAAGRFFGVFTSHIGEKRALDWALDVAKLVKARPAVAQWRPYIDRVLGRR